MKKEKFINDVLLEKEYYITSEYKARNENRVNHNGVDLTGKNGSDYIISALDGVVINSLYSKDAGYYVEIKHNNGYITRYLHLKKGSVKVKKGDVVKKGDILGYMGDTGNASGVHLHFAVLDKDKNVVDPLIILMNLSSYDAFMLEVNNILKSDKENVFFKTITISKSVNNKHKLVKVLQRYLSELGFVSVGKIDGIAGNKFTKAVKEYQKSKNIYVDGVITLRHKCWMNLLGLSIK